MASNGPDKSKLFINKVDEQTRDHIIKLDQKLRMMRAEIEAKLASIELYGDSNEAGRKQNLHDVQQEVIAFLLEKLKLYKPHKGKAYSYFGTIAKRYLILKNKKNYQKLQDKGDLAEVDDDKKIKEETINSYYSQDYSITEFMSLYIRYVDKNLSKLFPKENDAKTADAIMELFRKCESLDIFNKKALYIYIREMVDVDTPQITKIIKKLKSIYVDLYNKYYQEGYIKI